MVAPAPDPARDPGPPHAPGPWLGPDPPGALPRSEDAAPRRAGSPGGDAPPVPLGRRTADAVVVGTSACVLVLELLGLRLLAPYVGLTLETTSAVIATVLGGIAAGAWLGGRAADRRPGPWLLVPILALGGLSAVLIPWLTAALGPVAQRTGAAGALVLSAATVLAPATILSAAPPVVAKLALADLSRTGSVVGRVSALGTAGAIGGTLLTGFLLVRLLPVRATVVGVGLLLLVAAVVLAVRLRGEAAAAARALTLGVLLAAVGLSLAGGPCQVDTRYYCARIEVAERRPSERTLVLDTLLHARVDHDDPRRLGFPYVRRIADVADLAIRSGRAVRSVHVGGGGFTLPRYLAATRPGATAEVLEVDPGVVDLARARLGLRDGPGTGVRVRIGDARTTIGALPAGRADLVVGDAFGGLAVPWHLTTTAFLDEVRRVLRPDGVYSLNVVDGPPLDLARAMAATLRARFSHVVAVTRPDVLAGARTDNVVLHAADRPLPTAALGRRARRAGQRLLDEEATAAFAGDARVLTDDRAPVDQLLGAR